MNRLTMRMEVADPASVEFELSIRMSLGDWMRLRDQLMKSADSHVWPLTDLHRKINEMAMLAERSIYQGVEMSDYENKA